ncbi:MAG: FeoC-like transcriptional regulator [Acidihalobacter sp.]
MSPSEVKHYLQARGIAPLSDLVNRFGCDAEAMRGVLEFWERKGRVRRLAGQEGCAASCGGCADGACATPALSAVYQWVERDTRPSNVIPVVPLRSPRL